AADAADGELQNESRTEEHWRLPADLTSPHGAEPVEYFHAGGHGDNHAAGGKKGLLTHRQAGREHVMGPDDEADKADCHTGESDEGVAEDRLAGEDGDDLGRHAEGREDHDIDLGMPEAPEDVLPHHDVAAL